MFDPTLRRFMDEAPVCVAARATLERLLRPEWLDALFRDEARRQYESKLLFSTLVGLMGQVVLGTRRSVHEAYQHAAEASAVSLAAVYDKLNGLEVGVSAALVRRSAAEARVVLEHLPAAALPPPPLAGYEVRIVDGNHLAGTQSRIEELRHTRSGALPGQALVVLDPRRRLMLEAVPCEDAHAQERSLVPAVLTLVGPGELWIADRNFCTTAMLCGIRRRGACFLVRQHASTLTWEEAGPWRACGRCETGKVVEQPVRIWDPGAAAWAAARRVKLELDQPTRDGDREIYLLTDLPAAAATAAEVADLYGGRWQVEGAFGELTAALRCEVDTLGYPRAALFAFCLALLSYNAVSLVKAAMAAAHGRETVKDEVSFYQLAREVAATATGMEVAVPGDAWAAAFGRMTPRRFAQALVGLAGRMDLRRYRKHPRGPKKKRPPQTHGRRVKHVATARILARRKASSG
jgi:hypothetical protein